MPTSSTPAPGRRGLRTPLFTTAELSADAPPALEVTLAGSRGAAVLGETVTWSLSTTDLLSGQPPCVAIKAVVNDGVRYAAATHPNAPELELTLAAP